MSTQTNSSPVPVPSTRRLLGTTAVAIGVAMILLITAVLPAEFGIDPSGIGGRLGLTAIAEPPPAVEQAPPAGQKELAPTVAGPVSHFAVPYRMDRVQLVIGPYQFVEYKYRLEKGAPMFYAWSATATPNYDFHGEREGGLLSAADDAAGPSVLSYDKAPKREAQGALTAPFTGIHGWYWENTGGEAMTITLTSAGFYSAALELRSPKVRRSHELTTLDRLIFPPPPSPSGPDR